MDFHLLPSQVFLIDISDDHGTFLSAMLSALVCTVKGDTAVPGNEKNPARNRFWPGRKGSGVSATALFFGAASASLGRGLLGIAFGVTFRAASAALGRASDGHEACSGEQTGDTDPCQELFQFLSVHGTPPFAVAVVGKNRKTEQYHGNDPVDERSLPMHRSYVNRGQRDAR
jgi:hypothetical protein